MHHHIVQTGQQRIVILAGSGEQGRLKQAFASPASLAAGQYPQIVDTGLLKSVKLAVQTLPVAAFSFRAEYRSRPEVSAGETVDGISAVKLSVGSYGDVCFRRNSFCA